MNRPTDFRPQDDYLLTQATTFSDVDQDVAIRLYQPLIGPTALALYLTLWQEVNAHPTIHDRHRQTRLLDLLGVDIDALYDARVRLEALGLLQTYRNREATSQYWAYELYRPAAPEHFFDDTLGLLLYERVGQTRYAELAAHYALHTVRAPQWQNVSASLLDVFSLNRVSPSPAAASANEKVRTKTPPVVSVGDGAGYDWALLGQLLAKANVKPEAIQKNRAALYQIAGFYGLAPAAFARLIERATDFATGGIKLKELRELAEQTYAGNQPRLTPVPNAQNQPAADSQWSQADQALLKRAKELSVRDFLETTKTAKNASMFVSSYELTAVRKLVERNVFGDATINVLIDYVLRTNDSINQAFLDAIANRWLKAGVATPEQALLEIRAFAAAKAKPKPRPTRQGNRQEKMPEWTKPDYQAPKQAADPNQEEQIAAKLAALKALERKGSDGQ